MEYIIFALDESNAENIALLMVSSVTGPTSSNLIPCIGSWQGTMELSYIVGADDYFKHIAPLGLTENQEALLHIRPGAKGRYYGALWWANGEVEELGVFEKEKYENLHKHQSWTYRPDLDTYYVTRKGA